MANNLIIQFSLGYNFDPGLIDEVSELNKKYWSNRIVNEFFAALPNSPLLSTRPNNRIPIVTWREFASQIKKMAENGINFNYLLNAKVDIKEIDISKITDFIKKLYDTGISQLIIYSPELCSLIKNINEKFSITISSVFNTKTKEQIDEAYNCGADYIYLDSIFINRNFNLLRQLRKHSKIPLKLYANVSCLSQCNNKDFHYSVLSNPDGDYQIKINDRLFHFCSLEKLNNPVKWIQMQWIRPEDVDAYVEEGFNCFKLTDRLATTENLTMIAEYYLRGLSPLDLFPLIERNSTKYRSFIAFVKGNYNPLYIDNSKIPKDFIDHFKSGNCDSNNSSCKYCNQIAKQAIKVSMDYQNEIGNSNLCYK